MKKYFWTTDIVFYYCDGNNSFLILTFRSEIAPSNTLDVNSRIKTEALVYDILPPTTSFLQQLP